jgi:hypothetical protein
MILKPASHKAIKYAIMNWHYSKSIPVVQCAYAVFENDKWCGVICYGTGANNNIAKPYALQQGQVIELVRVALNGKQSNTSKAVSISLKLVKKDNPLVKLIVSYADIDQDHTGIIYQATNWYYEGGTMIDAHDCSYLIKGKRIHGKSISDYCKRNGLSKTEDNIKELYNTDDIEKYYTKGKHKYIYPLDKKLVPLCEELSKEYPKNASLA